MTVVVFFKGMEGTDDFSIHHNGECWFEVLIILVASLVTDQIKLISGSTVVSGMCFISLQYIPLWNSQLTKQHWLHLFTSWMHVVGFYFRYLCEWNDIAPHCSENVWEKINFMCDFDSNFYSTLYGIIFIQRQHTKLSVLGYWVRWTGQVRTRLNTRFCSQGPLLESQQQANVKSMCVYLKHVQQ